jgi:hypothetical protein
MNRFTSAVPAVLVLSAASAVALAADETPSTATPAAVAATATQATSTAPNAKAVATRVSTTAPPVAGHPSVQRLVCLNMSLQCFAMKPNADDAPAKTQARSLDLKAPDIRRIVPEVELRPSADEEPAEIEDQQVQVEGSRPEVYVPGGIASLPWAVMHPAQAWRILLPVPPGVAK